MIDIVALRSLHQVRAHGTLARAAHELGFTASAVSQQIKRLEREVGTALIAPSGRGVVLTPAGRALADSAQGVFAALEIATTAARCVADEVPTGTLRVVAFSTGIRGLVAPALARLQRELPRLRVEVSEQDPHQALASVDAGGADVALVHDADGVPPSAPTSVRQRDVHVDAGDIVMPRDHPFAGGAEPLTAAQLSAHDWVTSPVGTVCHQWFRRLFVGTDREPVVQHVADDFATQMSLVASSNVVALMPRLARPALPEGVVVRPLRSPPTRTVRAAWRESADASPALHALLDALGPATSADA